VASGNVIVLSAVGSVTASNVSFASAPPEAPSKVIPLLNPPLLDACRTIFPAPPSSPTCNFVIAWILVKEIPVIVSPKAAEALPKVMVLLARLLLPIDEAVVNTVPVSSGNVIVLSAVGSVTPNNVSKLFAVAPSKIIFALVTLTEFAASCDGTKSSPVETELRPAIVEAVAPSATAVLPIVTSSFAN